MRRVAAVVLVLALAGCAAKPGPTPHDLIMRHLAEETQTGGPTVAVDATVAPPAEDGGTQAASTVTESPTSNTTAGSPATIPAANSSQPKGRVWDVRVELVTTHNVTVSWLQAEGTRQADLEVSQPFACMCPLDSRSGPRWQSIVGSLAAGQDYTFSLAVEEQQPNGWWGFKAVANGTFHTLPASLAVTAFNATLDGSGYRAHGETTGPGIIETAVIWSEGRPPSQRTGFLWSTGAGHDSSTQGHFNVMLLGDGHRPPPDVHVFAQARVQSQGMTAWSDPIEFIMPRDPADHVSDVSIKTTTNRSGSIAWSYYGSADQSGQLQFGRDGVMDRPYFSGRYPGRQDVSFDGMVPGGVYDVRIVHVDNASGQATYSNRFQVQMPP